MAVDTAFTSPSGRPALLRFGLLAVGLYLLWFVGYEQTLAPDGRFDTWLCENIAHSSAGLLRGLDFATSIDAQRPSLLLMDGRPAVVVGAPCNGAVLYALFAGFVIAFPGPWQRKLWFIPLGMGFIWLLNVLRVAALALNHHYARQSVDFNHHYTFAFVVYGCIFGLWMLWAKRLAQSAQRAF